MKTLGFFVVAIILSLAFESEACKCAYRHPQLQYCEADYVIVVKVLSEYEVDAKTIAYNVDIRKIWKASDAAYEYLQNEVLTTASTSPACGITLKIGVNYVIFGKSTKIGLCQYIEEYSKLKPIQRKFIKSEYKKGCKCNIVPSSLTLTEEFKNSCGVPSNSNCEFTFGICLPKWINGVRKCAWRESTEYRNCLK